MHLLGDVAGLLEVVHGQVAVGVVLALLCQKQVALVGRELHASDLLQLVRHHDEVDLADVQFVCTVVHVADRNVMTYDEAKNKSEPFLNSQRLHEILLSAASSALTDRVDEFRLIKEDDGVLQCQVPSLEARTKGISENMKHEVRQTFLKGGELTCSPV